MVGGAIDHGPGATAAVSSWPLSPSRPVLGTDEVHVWSAWLSHDPSCLAALAASFSAEERARASRYRFEHDRAHFVARRAMRRAILAAYTGAAPDTLSFRLGPQGKPALAGVADALRFNASHSAGLMLLAVTRGRDLGVDLERIRPQLTAGIAERFFSPLEVAALDALAAEDRAGAFFAGWTRKEAYVKARGDGLALGLEGFAVSLAPGEPARLVQTAEAPSEVQRWRLEALHPAPGYAAALAVEGRDWRLRCWHWRPACGCGVGT